LDLGEEELSTFVILVFLLGASAFFSASETALFSLPKTRIEGFRRDRRRLGRAVWELLSKPSNLLITILIGNMTVNILSSSLSAHFLTGLFGKEGLALSIVGMWFLILVCGEVTPKIIAIRQNERLAPYMAWILSGFGTVVSPLRLTLNFVTDSVMRLLRQREIHRQETLTEKELKTAFRLGHHEGELDEREERILRRIIEFESKSVKSAMTPRGDIVACDVSKGLEGILQTFRENHFSRIPVYRDSFRTILGIAYIKDFLTQWEQAQRDFISLLRPAFFVPEQQKIERLFLQLQRRKTSMALVVDEYGSLEGLVTLHDLLEEIVGDVPQRDEESECRVLGSNAWLVRAQMTATNFEDSFSIQMPDGDYDTIGGYLIGIRGELPQVGEHFELGDLIITVHQREESRLNWLRVERKKVDLP